MVGVPIVVHVSQLEKSWYRLCMSEMSICGNEKLSLSESDGSFTLGFYILCVCSQ